MTKAAQALYARRWAASGIPVLHGLLFLIIQCCVQLKANLALQTHQDENSPRSTIQQRRVVFKTTHQVNYGEVIKVVGQGPQLGKWEVRTAPGDDSTQRHMHCHHEAGNIRSCSSCEPSAKFLLQSLHVRSHGVVRRRQLVSGGGLVSRHH